MLEKERKEQQDQSRGYNKEREQNLPEYSNTSLDQMIDEEDEE